MKRRISDLYRIGIQRRIRKGLRITIIPSYACNYKCSYCSRIVDGKYPTAKVKTMEEWKKYLTDLDLTFRMDRSKIKEVVITGGEPTLLPYFNELCDWITERWILVVYTNLSDVSKLTKLRQTPRLIIHASYHAGETDGQAYFNERWEYVDKYHRTIVDEIGERVLKNSHKKTRLKPFATKETLNTRLAMLRVDPNQAAYLHCTDGI